MTELYKAGYTLYKLIGDNTDDIATYSTRDEAVNARRLYLEANPQLNIRDDVKIRVDYQFIATIKEMLDLS